MSIDLQQRGATDVLDASYASLFSELSGAFRARGLTTEEARDFAQESLVRTFVHLKRHGQTRPDLRPLAHTIAKRLYVERGRRARPQFVDLPQAEEVVDPAPQPADAVVAMEEQRDVQAALRTLAPRHRRVISLWMTGLRPAEIARELGIKRNAADALLHRARRQLATKLDPGRAAFGLIGVIVLRLRAGMRRMVDAVASLDPSGSVTQAGTGLAFAGIAAILLAASPASGGTTRVEVPNVRGPTATIADVDDVAPAGDRATPPRLDVVPKAPAFDYSVRNRTWVHNPRTGEKDDVGLGLFYTPDDTGKIDLDPALEPAMSLTCGVSAKTCTSGE